MKQSFFCRGEVKPPKYVSFHIISSMTFARDTLIIANFDLGNNVIFVTLFFWIKKAYYIIEIYWQNTLYKLYSTVFDLLDP